MALEGRILFPEGYNDAGYSDEKHLSRLLMTKPDEITPVITHLMGNVSDKFPMIFTTEGRGKSAIKTIEVDDVQYEWPYMGDLRFTSQIKDHDYIAGDKPGVNNTPVIVYFEDNWLKYQHSVVTPSGVTLRVMYRGEVTARGYKYTFQLQGRNPAAYVSLEDLQIGVAWAMEGGAPVSASLSEGNESNTQTPGKLKNQISILRKSYHIAGNIGKRPVVFQFSKDGKTSNYWMDWEEWQHTIKFMQACEEHVWYSEYNRDVNGQVMLIDPTTNQEIPIGAGVIDQIPNRDTFGKLTMNKLRNVVGDITYNTYDGLLGKQVITLYTGKGGLRDFDEAIKDDLSGWTTLNAESFMKNEGSRNMVYGGFFKAFEHVDGHVVQVRELPILDTGARAQVAPKHPKTNMPITSHNMYFIDQSVYDGIPNVQMVSQRNRSMIRGVEQGMSLLPGQNGGGMNDSRVSLDYKGNALNLSTDKDKTSLHLLKTTGVCIRRNTLCMALEFDLDKL